MEMKKGYLLFVGFAFLVLVLVFVSFFLPDVMGFGRPFPEPEPGYSEQFWTTPGPLSTEKICGRRLQIPGGEYTVGVTEDEGTSRHEACLEMTKRTGQPRQLCEPKDMVWLDNLVHKVELKDFWMDVCPAYDASSGLPLVVSVKEAKEYCEKRGGELPTAEQYQAAMIYVGVDSWKDIVPGTAQIDFEGGNPNLPLVAVNAFSPQGEFYDLVGNAGTIVIWDSPDGWIFPALMGGRSGAWVGFGGPGHLIYPIEEGGVRCVFQPY